MRTLHHDDRLAQRNKGISSTGQSNDAQPTTALPKCRTVNEQDRAARERQYRNAWQQNPEHPLSEACVSRGRYSVVTLCGHASHDRRENRVERLVHSSQAIGGTDHGTVNTDCCKRNTGCTPNKITKQD